ncbi:MAG: hypothetical protein R6U50_18550 [Desulfobacterales bacterium]
MTGCCVLIENIRLTKYMILPMVDGTWFVLLEIYRPGCKALRPTAENPPAGRVAEHVENIKENHAMNDRTEKKRLDDLEKEIETTWDAAHRRLLELRARVDRLETEIMVLKRFLADEDPSFDKRFSRMLQETLDQFSPE